MRHGGHVLTGKSLYVFGPTHPVRTVLIRVVTHPAFDTTMFVGIFVSCVVMAMETPNMSEDLRARLEIVDYVLAAVFTLEAVLKITPLTFMVRRRRLSGLWYNNTGFYLLNENKK